MFALIFQGKVADVSPATFTVAPAMSWVDISQLDPQPTHGWAYDGAVFTPPVEPETPQITIEQAQAIALASVNRAFDAAASGLTAGYPVAETLTWPDQQREVLAYLADNNAATPYIDALAAARGITRELYITKTLAKVNLFKVASAALVGKRQKLVDQIQAAATAEEALAVQWT